MLKVFSYNNIGPGPSFIQETEHLSHLNFLYEKDFFSGACFTCATLATEIRMQRCAGCQLVAYCNKKCQKADWKKHKTLCKKFPVEKGKNVIVKETESVAKDPMRCLFVVTELQRSALMAVSAVDPRDGVEKLTYGVNNMFLHARVCNICHEARPEMLFDCRCCAVSYCGTHNMQDAYHLSQECDILYHCAMANWYLTQHHRLQIPDGLLNEASINYGLKFKKVSKLAKYSSENWLETIVNLINERLGFSLTIHHALKNLKLGEQRKALTKITSLTIHIVHTTPILDPRMWEFFLHQLPNLKTLNLTFISGIMRIYNKYNSCLPVERCSDCKRKQRVINYNIHTMHYHEYFSSNDYVQPDVVVVFGTEQELMHTMVLSDKAHCFASQRNMTYSKHTVVILTDFLEETLEASLKSFHDARPVNILLPVQYNPVCGFSTFRISGNITANINNFVCCIQGKH